MIDLLELWKRSESGPEIGEREFDMKILPKKLEELRKEYGIRYNPEEVVSTDASLAKAVYEAALKLLCDVGVYCTDSGRVIQVSEEEVEEALRSASTRLFLGGGKERIELAARRTGDGRRPLIAGGPCGCPLSEKFYRRILYSYAKETSADIMVMGPLESFKGMTIKPRSPIEMAAARTEAVEAREAAKAAGKPGLCIFGGISVVTAAASNFADSPDGLRPTDLHEVAQLNELKMSWEVFNRMTHCQYQGNLVAAAQCPVLGQAGGPEATAILCAAEALQAFTLTRGHLFCMAPSHMWTSTTTDREDLWVSCLVMQAVKGVHPVPMGSYIYSAAGPCTEIQCYELAAQTATHTASGADLICSAGGTRGTYVNHYTGMEARIAGEICQASASLRAVEVNELVKELLSRYEEPLRMRKAPPGKRFEECYDIEKISPSEEYVRLWETVKRELENLGMNFP
ncbi:monomethylamine:corrinoid methyltransferase [Candidatus Hecatella orcuttiae]|uniref:monomethylamine:corrinoid methyltransferase n=1 Tax=Candidatus Hecatella orcuttiae TaxID=1935119 RepID=UPI002867C788|nr:monomethylamine:corrinoid methyltransferase [Candidatus Hecatella orcuttiae]